MIKFFESTDAGAPTLNNAVGSMIAVLDACLITGYNSKAVTSITVSSGVATVVCTAHAYANTYGKKIRIAGATGSFTALNKDTDIANVTTNGFTFLCPGVVDGVATGTITAKYAPLDWTKQYSGTNKAMYKRGDVTATGCMLRIDDNVVGQSCRALMVQSATDVDTYTNPAPVPAQIADGLGQYWSKGYGTSTAADWFIVADGLLFYLFVRTGVTSTWPYYVFTFGDAPSFRPGDALNCIMFGGTSASTVGGLYAGVSTAGVGVISGGKNGVATSQVIYPYAKTPNYGIGDGSTYPSTVDGGMCIAYPCPLFESPLNGVTGDIRGLMPGLAIPLAITSALTQRTQINNIPGYARAFLYVSCGQVASSTSYFTPLIDLTGPWR